MNLKIILGQINANPPATTPWHYDAVEERPSTSSPKGSLVGCVFLVTRAGNSSSKSIDYSKIVLIALPTEAMAFA